MNNAIILQQVYQDSEYTKLAGEFIPRHLEYAKQHDFDYEFYYGNISQQWGGIENGGWAKLGLILYAFSRGYEYVVWLDTDALIADTGADLRKAFPEDGIGLVVHNGPPRHYNVGVMYCRNSESAKNFISYWLTWFPGPVGWRDQAMLNLLVQVNGLENVIKEIDPKYNSTRLAGCHVERSVVEGFHGEGKPEERLRKMKEFTAK